MPDGSQNTGTCPRALFCLIEDSVASVRLSLRQKPSFFEVETSLHAPKGPWGPGCKSWVNCASGKPPGTPLPRRKPARMQFGPEVGFSLFFADSVGIEGPALHGRIQPPPHPGSTIRSPSSKIGAPVATEAVHPGSWPELMRNVEASLSLSQDLQARDSSRHRRIFSNPCPL